MTNLQQLARSRKKQRPGDVFAMLLPNRKGWSEGVFETVGNVPLGDGDVLDQHCFRRWNGKYFDECSNQLPGPVEPVGDFGLHSFRTIDDDISDALGFERVPD